MTGGWLPQRAGSPSLNGGGTAAAVPPTRRGATLPAPYRGHDSSLTRWVFDCRFRARRRRLNKPVNVISRHIRPRGSRRTWSIAVCCERCASSVARKAWDHCTEDWSQRYRDNSSTHPSDLGSTTQSNTSTSNRFTVSTLCTHVGARPGSPCDMRPCRLVTNKYHQNEAFLLVKCIQRYMYRICRWTFIKLVLVWCKSIYFWQRYTRKNDVCIFDPVSAVTLIFDLQTPNLLY